MSGAGRPERRVLMVSAHFPPDSTAAAHRVRLLAPHLPRYGWEPTVLTVDPRDYEGRLDPELARLVPPDLRVVRCRAWPARITRRLGVGDLGLRALPGMLAAAARLLARERFDALLVTIYPAYSALLGPVLKRRFRVPFVLDYQDPWVGAWGATVGPGPGGRPDLKSRLSRFLASRLEPRTVRRADALVAVSAETHALVRRRYRGLGGMPCATIPLGGEPADFEALDRRPRANPAFEPGDGCLHVCAVGTVLPHGGETLRAVLSAVAMVRARPGGERLRLHFIGTSHQSLPGAPPRVLPVARELGVADCVSELPTRVSYLDALAAHADAGAILLMGSSERHYTASKLYPGLLVRKPIVAVFHRASSVVDILGRAARPPAAYVVTYDDADRAGTRVGAIAEALEGVLAHPSWDAAAVDHSVVEEFSARSLAGRLAGVLDAVAAGP